MQFRLASTRIETLQTTYHFLLLGKEESALRMLEGVTKVAKVRAVLKGLQIKFESETQKVNNLVVMIDPNDTLIMAA